MKFLFVLLFLVACSENQKEPELMSTDKNCVIEPVVKLFSTVLGCEVYSVREPHRFEDVSCEWSTKNFKNSNGGRHFLLSKCDTPSSVQYNCGKNCTESNSTN